MTRAHACLAAGAMLVSACKMTEPIERSKHLGTREENVDISQVPVLGSNVDIVQTSPLADVHGELLAVDSKHLWVMNAGGATPIHVDGIREARVPRYDGQAAVGGVWTALGAISGISHGYWLLISGPLWGAIGGASAATMSAGESVARPGGFMALKQYARFPQGLPAVMWQCAIHSSDNQERAPGPDATMPQPSGAEPPL